MADLVNTDDELELEDQQRRNRAGTIGYLPRPNPSSTQLPADVPPPDVGAISPSTTQTISGIAPYNPLAPAAPRPQSQAFTDWQAQDLAKHPAGQPRYHGLARIADTIAGVTNIGRLAEEAGEFGTLGARAKADRLAGNAAQEDTQIGYGEKERQANALTEEQANKAETERVGSEVQQIPLPGGGTAGVMTRNIAPPAAAIISSEGRKDVAKTGAEARVESAQIAADARGANVRQPIRVMGDETYERTPDGNWKVIGKAPARAESGGYVPINDEGGNTVGWVNPKSGHMIRVDEIPGMTGEGGAAPGGVIPAKPLPSIMAGEKSAQDSLNYAQQYRASGKFTGPGDEALMEQFFNVAKPSSGFRMSQPQINMLLSSRSWMESAEGIAYHAQTGVWFPPDQRNNIIDTMIALGKSKGVGERGNPGAPGGGHNTPPSGKVIRYDQQGNRIQ